MLIKQSHSIKHKNSDTCTVWEYPYEDIDSSFAVGEINGRYPDVGFAIHAVNEECAEMFYILSGTLTLHMDNQIFVGEEGDFLRIEKDHEYFLEGESAKFCIFNTPQWKIDQHKNISI
jgi:mannose-6-phosphate isomerase-like protein (cupin superfamily)